MICAELVSIFRHCRCFGTGARGTRFEDSCDLFVLVMSTLVEVIDTARLNPTKIDVNVHEPHIRAFVPKIDSRKGKVLSDRTRESQTSGPSFKVKETLTRHAFQRTDVVGSVRRNERRSRIKPSQKHVSNILSELRDSPILWTRNDAAKQVLAVAKNKPARPQSRSSSQSSSSSSTSSWSSLSNISSAKALDSVRKNKWEKLYAALIRARKNGQPLPVDAWKDQKGSSALAVAAALNHVDTLLVLYGVGGANLEEANDNGYTPLSIASKYGQLEAVKILLRCGASTSARNSLGETPLTIAANQIVKAAKRKDAQKYKDLLEICHCIVQRSKKIDNGLIEGYTRDDDKVKRIKNVKSRTLINEWIRSKESMKDSHFPSMSTFRSSRPKGLKAYFEEQHQDLDLETWAKIVILLMFVYYDFVYGPRNVKLYLVLYVLAYAL